MTLAENPDFQKALTLAEEDYRTNKRTGPLTIKVHFLAGTARSLSIGLEKKLDSETQLIHTRNLPLTEPQH